MTNLAESLLAQIRRCRVIQDHAREIGPAGHFLVTFLTVSIARAEDALAAGDVVQMIAAIKDLEGFRE